jgi:hypothetical protein
MEIRRDYRWLRGLATTLTCSSMHLDWNYPYGGVGAMGAPASKINYLTDHRVTVATAVGDSVFTF